MVVYFSGSWKILSGNEIATLLGWWLMECHKKNHPNDIPGLGAFILRRIFIIKYAVISRKRGEL